MGKIIQFPGIEREVSPEYLEAVDYFLFLKAPDPAVKCSHNIKNTEKYIFAGICVQNAQRFRGRKEQVFL